jgi:hypothetical protein
LSVDICLQQFPGNNEQSGSALGMRMSHTPQSTSPEYWVDRGAGSDLFAIADDYRRRIDMLWTIFVVLGIMWLLGFSLHVGGGLIHLLLIVAVVVLIINLLGGRRGTA